MAPPKKKSEWHRRDVWEVDLRPHDKRKYFSPKDTALGEAQIQRTGLRNEGLEGFEFTFEQRTDAKMPMAVLAGSCLSLTQAPAFRAENQIAAREFPITADAPRQRPVP